MRVVLDASAAIEIALEREHSKIFLEKVKNSSVVLAPDTFVSEVTNVFWKYKKFQQFTDDVCIAGIEFCINLVDIFVDSKELWREAYLEGIKNNSSPYDMFYLVVARRNVAKILSCDKKLFEIAQAEKLT
ncbi:type II toxin-antitoxin system VapC family toxin [Gracilinema caldarium]|uniref:type II toxin-antitoxin system VapC family toxin n=1 Tax=Gracilinema caldarium TaxID=215591 RepID=UPI0026F1C8EC|nr:type II toxin-antitoxin system VapC family toxin [Gracilinema caldarium]